MACSQGTEEITEMGEPMKNKELKQILERKDIPALSAEARDRIVKTSVACFKEAEGKVSKQSQLYTNGFSRFWLPAMGVVACAVLALFTLMSAQIDQNQPVQITDTQHWEDRGKILLAQGEEMFSGSFMGVVLEYDEVKFLIAEDRQITKSQPIMIRLKDGENTRYVISYSGQSVPIKIDGKIVQLDILLTGKDTVIVGSDKFIWTEEQGSQSGINLDAKLMGENI